MTDFFKIKQEKGKGHAVKTCCNPMDLEYRFKRKGGETEPCREGADPGAVFWRGKYWCVSSKAAGVHWSEDLVNWHCVYDNILPHDGYGPDLYVRNGKLYFLIGFVRTTVFEAVDPERGMWKRVGGEFQLYDPKFFSDDDGRLYCFTGCTAFDPIIGAELDPETCLPVTPWLDLVAVDLKRRGWERPGENNGGTSGPLIPLLIATGERKEGDPQPELAPWNEGTFITKHNGKYYLQNSAAGTEFNVYSDGISVSGSPLGPYTRQKDNPFSYKPGGFITGAGHSCSFEDKYGNLFHLCTQRIAKRYKFERRISMFPAAYTEDGTLICYQRFGDYPHYVPDAKLESPDCDLFTGWMLQSLHAKVSATSFEPGFEPEFAVDEDIRTNWAALPDDPAPALTVDLGKEVRIRAVQINFAERHCTQYAFDGPRGANQYLLEVSSDGKDWQTAADRRANTEDKTHRYHELALHARFVRLSVTHAAAGGVASVSGLRVFGDDGSGAPGVPENVAAARDADDRTKVKVSWIMPENAHGINIRWGLSPDRMHHTWQLPDGTTQFTLPALDAELDYFIAVEAFGRGGVSPMSAPIGI